jgi:membrane protein
MRAAHRKEEHGPVSTPAGQARRVRDAAEAAWRRLGETRAGSYLEALLVMRIVDRALALASKLFIAILPLSILSTAFISHRAFGDELIQRFGLSGEAARAARALFASPTQVQSAIGLLGLLILVSSVLSFARALENVYLDCWQLPALKGAVRSRLMWLTGFVAYLVVISPAHSALAAADDARLIGVASAFGAGALFLWTPYVLLGRRVAWRRLVPTAAVSGAAVLLFGVASTFVLPPELSHETARYGYIGFAFSMVSWLFCGAVLIVATAVLGALMDQWRRGLPGAVAGM